MCLAHFGSLVYDQAFPWINAKGWTSPPPPNYIMLYYITVQYIILCYMLYVYFVLF